MSLSKVIYTTISESHSIFKYYKFEDGSFEMYNLNNEGTWMLSGSYQPTDSGTLEDFINEFNEVVIEKNDLERYITIMELDK